MMASLGYKQVFEDGSPTLFREKIKACEGIYTVEITTAVHPSPPAFNTGYELSDTSSLAPKIHTIREDAKDMWYPGRTIHHCYGNRTKQRECFLVNKCISTQRIQILWQDLIGINTSGEEEVMDEIQVVFVDGRKMSDEVVKQLAINDGFNSVEHFFAWFSKDFSGKIIHWTKHRY